MLDVAPVQAVEEVPPQLLKLSHAQILVLNALDKQSKKTQLAAAAGVGVDMIDTWLRNDPDFAVEWERRHTLITLRGYNTIQRAAALAAETMVDHLESADPQVSLRAAENILDRTGVPKVSKSVMEFHGRVDHVISVNDVMAAAKDVKSWEEAIEGEFKEVPDAVPTEREQEVRAQEGG